MLTRALGLAALLCLLAGCADEPDGDEPASETASGSTVEVFVIKRNAATGCWASTTEEWPAEYWGEQVSDGCGENDIERYFQRGEDCYHVSGSCGGWVGDPEVTLCQPSSESCCGSEDCGAE